MTPSRLSKLDAVFIFVCGLLFFTIGLRHQEIIGFESRFYLFALEMWRHGLSWFPTTYQAPYPDYPVTSTALIYFTAKLFGTLNKWVAVLPSAIAAALTLSATYLIGARQARRWGWYSAGFLIFTLAFLTEARTISLDMYVTAVTAWLFYFAYSAKLQARAPSWFMVGLLLVISFAIRGPIGIVIPTGVLTVFYVLEKDWKSWFFLSILSCLLLLICTGILLSIAHHVGGNSFMQSVFNMEIAGRMEVNRTPPGYFYFVESFGAFAMTYPLAILVILGVLPQLIKIKKDTSSRVQFIRMLVGWVLVIMLGLSVPADKKIRYILPIAPALALICASLLMEVQTSFLQWVKKSFYLLCWIFPLLSLGVLSVFFQRQVELNYALLGVFFVILQISILLTKHKEASFFIAAFTFFLVNVFIVEKINLHANQTNAFVKNIENLREKKRAKLVFYREGRDGLAIKYLVNMQHEENPLFIDDIGEMPAVPAFVIATEENFNALPENNQKSLHVIGTGKIGHDTVVVKTN